MRMRDSVMSTGAARLLTLVLLSLCMLGVAFADEADPSARVARLSYVQGSVSMQPTGQQDWVGAEINRPITTGDKLWSDAQGSRAELDIGGAAIRMGADTGFSFLNLGDNVAQMQVTAGTVIVHVRELLENQTYEVYTPNVALGLDQPGEYRVEVSDSGDSTVVRVADGQAVAAVGGQTYPVNNQQAVTFTGNGQQVNASASMLGTPDGFDDWSFERDREQDQAASSQYVADAVPGVEDLDENGQWQNTPDYGDVWVPTTAAVGWAPYTFGHWAWISPWGWTWIDNAPWGFAPFHYGRWARWHNSWCWVPPRQARPVYAPAMVAWVGGAAGGASVSWFPLGPREVYVPGYHVSDRYVRAVNISNTTVMNQAYITNVYQNRVTNIHYVNATVPGAVTTVARNVFTSAQPVNTHRVGLAPSQVARLSTSPTPPAITPVRQSILGGGPGGFVHRPPEALVARSVVAQPSPSLASSAHVRQFGPQPQDGHSTAFGRGPSSTLESRAGTPPQPRPGMSGASEQAPGRTVQQSRPSFQQRPPVQQQQGVGAPINSAETDTRSWADRAHALQQRSLPPSQPPRYQPSQPSPEEAGNTSGENRFEVPPQNRAFEAERPMPRNDRPPEANQPGRIEQPPPSVNAYSRPPIERPLGERPQFEDGHRSMQASPSPAPVPHFNATPPPQAPVSHFNATPPPQAPVSHFNATPPPPAPVPHFTATPPPPAPVPSSSQPRAQSPSRSEDRPAPRSGPRTEPR